MKCSKNGRWRDEDKEVQIIGRKRMGDNIQLTVLPLRTETNFMVFGEINGETIDVVVKLMKNGYIRSMEGKFRKEHREIIIEYLNYKGILQYDTYKNKGE